MTEGRLEGAILSLLEISLLTAWIVLLGRTRRFGGKDGEKFVKIEVLGERRKKFTIFRSPTIREAIVCGVLNPHDTKPNAG
jgi:hypothetical protein